MTEASASSPSIIDAAETIFAPWFRDRATWAAWFTVLRTLFGIPLADDEIELFRQCTGRTAPPPGGCNEAWLICGRRAGKSMILALIAVFLATCRDWSTHLSPGERGTVMVLAADRRQARTIFRYARALLLDVPELAQLVERETADTIDLTNGISIEIVAAGFRGVRGYTLIAGLCDELAFWRSEDGAANLDEDVLAALRPAMSTIPRAMLLCASSPYARRGALWGAYRRYFGKDDAPVLVWRAATKTMNPTVPDDVIAEAYERDPASAAAEHGAEFRSDVETFLSREVIYAAIEPDRPIELSPIAGTRYLAFTDPSGGAADSFALCIAHAEDRKVIVDAIRERVPPFSPEAVVAEYAGLLKTYGIREVAGDRYAGEWPRERFREHGVEYIASTKSASDLYREALPLFTTGKIELPDHGRLIAQLAALERRTARGGRDSVGHPPGAASHDDLAVCVAGVCVAAAPGHSLGSGYGVFGFTRQLAQELAAAKKPPEPPKPEWAPGSIEWAEQQHLAELARGAEHLTENKISD